MKNFKKQALAFIFLSIIAAFFVFVLSPVRADNSLVEGQTGLKEIGGMAYGGEAPADIRTTVAKIINVVLGFLGVIFVGLAVYAGFLYMTAAGNEDKTKEALTILRNAVIGLLVLLMAWAITRFTVIILGKATNNAVDYRTYYPY